MGCQSPFAKTGVVGESLFSRIHKPPLHMMKSREKKDRLSSIRTLAKFYCHLVELGDEQSAPLSELVMYLSPHWVMHGDSVGGVRGWFVLLDSQVEKEMEECRRWRAPEVENWVRRTEGGGEGEMDVSMAE